MAGSRLGLIGPLSGGDSTFEDKGFTEPIPFNRMGRLGLVGPMGYTVMQDKGESAPPEPGVAGERQMLLLHVG
jgi:hypothetical protein